MSDADVHLPRYVEEHQKELRALVRNGDPFIRTLALAILIRGGGRADLELVEKEVQLAQKLDEDTLTEVLS